MPLINLDNRLKHWSEGWTAVNQGDSPHDLIIPHIELFRDKNVLEIGPGEGRAFQHVKDVILSYSIADISESVLACEIWNRVCFKYLIRDYSSDLGEVFDVIHFWYVLHHVPSVELDMFFDFVLRHLKKDGILMFNTPYLSFDDGAYRDDGVLTTDYFINTIITKLEGWVYCLLLDGRFCGKSNGHVYVGKKL